MKMLPTKIALGFALMGYLVAIGLHFAPAAWHLSSALVLTICPANLLVMISMTDPSLGGIALVVAPLNAVLYGVLALVVGLSVTGRRDRGVSPQSS